MLKRNKQHKKLNNKGITLVELIVSITILMLVSGTLLSAFVVSMRMSKKSRDLHRATTVAQNVMEGVKWKTAEELAYQFNYPVVKDSAGNDISNFSVYMPSMFQFSGNMEESVGELYATVNAGGDPILAKTNSITYAEYEALKADPSTNAAAIAQASSAYVSNLSTDYYDFLKDKDGVYYYYLRNLENDGAYYNVRIKIDASEYRNTGSSSIKANSEKIISVPTIDSTYDAVEVMGNYDEQALTEFQLNCGAVDEKKIHRTITIKVENDPTVSAVDQTTVTVYYHYEYEYNGTLYEADYDNIAFDNTNNETVQQLRNVYLYYYPSYDRASATYRDDIVIENYDNKDMEVYIIKQEDINLSQGVLTTKEISYKVDFNVKETTTNAAGKSHVVLRTNLNQNLADIYTGISTTTNQVNWAYNSTFTTKDQYQTEDIKNKQEKDRMYDITIDVYESKSMSDSEFQGADISTWFDEDNHLITITSTSSQ